VRYITLDRLQEAAIDVAAIGRSEVFMILHSSKMLFGFELFSALRSGLRAEIIEVYPFAIGGLYCRPANTNRQSRAAETISRTTTSCHAPDGEPPT
jgi:hypothetical protein